MRKPPLNTSAQHILSTTHLLSLNTPYPIFRPLLIPILTLSGPGRTYSSLEIGRALNGLQSMSAETCPDVKQVLVKLAEQVIKSPDTLLARDAGLPHPVNIHPC